MQVLKPVRNLRLILTVLFVGIAILPVCIFKYFSIYSVQDRMVEERSIEIQNATVSLAVQLGQNTGAPEQKSLENQMSYIADYYDARVQLINPDFVIIWDSYAIDEGKTAITEAVFKGMKGFSYTNLNEEKHYLELVIPVKGSDSGIMSVLAVSCSTMDIYDQIEDIRHRENLIIWILVFVVIPLAFVLAWRLTVPFMNQVKNLRRIREGNLNLTLDETPYKELDRMNWEFSGIIGQLQQIDQSRQEFVSNVSHELKTPITSIRVLADSLLLQEDVPAELYREFLTDISAEIDRETEIINDLLTLVRMDKSGAVLNIESLNINELLENVLHRLRPIAQNKGIQLYYESHREAVADVDRVKLTLAFTNLIENGIKYNKEDGWVRVGLNADHKFCYVKVSDSGIGIPEESLEKVFDRFYRVDKARSRQTGGTGLGLAITKEIVLMHHGSIKVTSKEGEGSTFVVRIPRNYLP